MAGQEQVKPQRRDDGGPEDAPESVAAAPAVQTSEIDDILDEIDGVTCPEPEGAFYAYPSVRGLLGRELRGRTISSSAELAAIILDEAEVAVVPGEAFGTPGYLRLSYALGDEDLKEGIGRLATLLAEAR